MLHSPHNVGHAQLVAEGSPGLIMLVVSMAAHLSNFNLFQLRPSKLTAAASGKHSKYLEEEYTIDSFKREISTAYKRAGVNVSFFTIKLRITLYLITSTSWNRSLNLNLLSLFFYLTFRIFLV